ncbi:MAG: ribonuclease HII [Betaproteobacteria bacterium]|nr:ribonuclease HII [Betaproteobacteria bacterium]
MHPDRRYRRGALLPTLGPGHCGVDEAGRGPLAGPVMAAAVCLREGQSVDWARDSKSVTVAQREVWAVQIRASFHHGVGMATVEEIDRLNILQATLLAMQRAVAALPEKPDEVWVDGLHAPLLDVPTRAVVQGDQRLPLIAAASILAKVTRDQYMIQLSQDYPEYGFEKHKGYGSALHLAALQRFGPCPFHRRSFAPVREALR